MVTRNNAFMIYDQILATNSRGEVKPQMAQGWETSQDGLTVTFTLRDNLLFHDGEKVAGEGLRRVDRPLAAA